VNPFLSTSIPFLDSGMGGKSSKGEPEFTKGVGESERDRASAMPRSGGSSNMIRNSNAPKGESFNVVIKETGIHTS
jgi:hypothetical protein